MQNEEHKLILKLPKRVDINNASEVQSDFERQLLSNDACEVIVDASELEYISSSGLRVLLALKKKTEAFSVINVARNVYDIFEVAGFDKLFDVKKALREISVEGLDMLGKGATGRVYRIDNETIIKVFNEDFDMDIINLEHDNSQKTFSKGIETAIAYDIVKVGNQIGIVYEMINADTLRNTMRKDRERYCDYIEIYANFLKKMHNVSFEPGMLMSVKERYCEYINKITTLSDAEKAMVKEMISAVEDRNTFIHGDINTGNIMYQDGKPIMIDMGEAGIGHPLFDIDCVYYNFVLFPTILPAEYCVPATGFSKEEHSIIWNKFCEVYFGTTDEKERIKLEEQIRPFAALRVVRAATFVAEFPKEMVDYCKSIVIDANKDGVHRVSF